jgi:hypothetical protein
MPRETVNVLDACGQSPVTHFHNWMAMRHNDAWTEMECFCNRCRTRGIFTARELEHWRAVIEQIWATYGQDRDYR